jgi:hypothetical protein
MRCSAANGAWRVEIVKRGRIRHAIGMATDWPEIIKSVAPIATGIIGVGGVWVGSRLSSRTQRQAFLRERIFAEMTRRREVGARYKKALWLYARRVEKVRDMAGVAVEQKAKGKDISEMVYDLADARDQQLQLIDAFAELEHFATVEVQVAARNCMEALTASFNAAQVLEVAESRAKYAYFQQQYEVLMNELNAEGDQFNGIIDASLSPIRRMLVRRALGKPPAYKVPDPPTELRKPGEGVRFN